MEPDTIMTTDTQNPAQDDALDAKSAVPDAPHPETTAPPPAPASTAETGAQQPPDSEKVAGLWWLAAIVAVAAAVALTVVVALGTHFTTGQRAAAAGTALLVVGALAIVAHIILMGYQARLSAAGQPTLPRRRRGLKAAVMGQDNRASTSKTQVVLWTAAVVWALIDLLLLARAHPGGSLFTSAVTTNWRPEYLVLLGLPVAAAATAKAAVAGANSGQGPATSDPSSKKKIAGRLNVQCVYVRDPAPDVKGFRAGVAELFTGDDNSVDWGDLQYVVFTLVTLAYFAIQFLAQPANGLPPVPAALLTLVGVSATGYAANKVVSTKVNLKDAKADGQ